MTTVETVNGPVDVDAIGRTLTHEHIFTKNPEIEDNWPDPEWEGEEAMVQKAADTLNELKTLGIDSVIDLTVPGLGRFIPRIQKVAALTDVNIVVATGFYTFNALPTFFNTHGPGRAMDMDDPMPGFFIQDLTTGIADTGVKAVMIKIATDAPGITPDLSRVMTAAAIAHKETGATISTHTHAAEFRGRDQQEFFRKQGVPLEHVLVGHSGDSTDIDYLRELMDNGSTLGMDRFGMENVLPDSDRVDTVAKLVELGYAEKLTLSHDAGVYSINTTPAHRRKQTPNWFHAHISRDILPALRERGVSDADIDTMMITNAARILVGARG
jgi:phosphotriesterase-related protein